MAKGWIKLHRDILDHWVLSDPILLKVWIYLLLRVNHEERTILVNGKTIIVSQGQVWTSIRKLSVALEMGINTVKRKLAILEKNEMIFLDSRKGIGTLITVRNYAVYQGFEGAKKTDSGYTGEYTDGYKGGTQSDTQVDHKQEYKNVIRMNKEIKNIGATPSDAFEEY